MFSVAKEQGYYDDAGLDVVLEAPSSTSTSVTAVGRGSAQFGVTRAPQIIQARDAGIPIKGVAVLIPQLISGIMYRPDDPTISEPADLRGKTIGVPNDAEADALFSDFLSNVGLTKEDVAIVDPGFAAAKLLLDGQVDAVHELTVGVADDFTLQNGTPAKFFMYTDYGVPQMYYYTLAGNESWVSEHPNATASFIDATFKGLDHMRANIEETADLLAAQNEGLVREVHLANMQGLESYWTTERGLMDAATWQRTVEWLAEQQMIGRADPPAMYFTNEYIPGS